MSSNVAYFSRGVVNEWTKWYYPKAKEYNKMLLEIVDIPYQAPYSYIPNILGSYHLMSPANFRHYSDGGFPFLNTNYSIIVSYHKNEIIDTFDALTGTHELTYGILEVRRRSGIHERR